jgi:CubicO group peptidase (beta-lactamase class C family)
LAELQKGIKAPYNTIFNVASLTKPITAIVALKLVSDGKWDLDEPLFKYWIDPDIAKNPNHKLLTTRIILSHQTGFPNWRYLNKDNKLSFDYKPGTKYQYSGEGFEYLRKALEKKFNKTLDQLANELIFKPVNMTETQFFWTNKTDSARFAQGYNSEGIPYKTVKNKSANAADDLLTTVEDYGKFLVSVMDGLDLSTTVIEEMTKHQIQTRNGKFSVSVLRYMNWEMVSTPCRTAAPTRVCKQLCSSCQKQNRVCLFLRMQMRVTRFTKN